MICFEEIIVSSEEQIVSSEEQMYHPKSSSADTDPKII